jgi:hypothetical protein
VLWLKQLVASFPPQRPGFKPRSGYVGFVVDKAALGKVSSKYFGVPCQLTHYFKNLHFFFTLSNLTKLNNTSIKT